MNDENLIELVRQYPVLYDQSNSKYMDTDFKNSLWRKIGAQMKTDGSSCKTRWSNIRDNFRKSLNKQKTKSGQKAKNFKPYKYSDQLNFLVKVFAERETMTNIEEEVTNTNFTGDEEGSEDVSHENEGNNQDCTTKVTTDPVTVEPQSQNAAKSIPSGSTSIPLKKTKRSAPNNNPPKTAAATLMEYIVQRNASMASLPPPQHPVDAFLAGIAPALKKLPPQDWHYAKGEIFAIVQKYEFKEILNRQQVVERGAFSECSTPSNLSEQPSHSGSYQSTSGDGYQSRSTETNQENTSPNYSLQDYFHNFPE